MGGVDVKFLTCPHCHRECESKFALDKHMLIKHSSSAPYIPQSQSSQLLQQSLNGAEPKLKVFECPYCFTLHANKDRFKKHLGLVPFVYSDCMVNRFLIQPTNPKLKTPNFRSLWMVKQWLDKRTRCTARFAGRKRPTRPSCTPTNLRTPNCRGLTSAATQIVTSILFSGASWIGISRCTSRRATQLSQNHLLWRWKGSSGAPSATSAPGQKESSILTCSRVTKLTLRNSGTIDIQIKLAVGVLRNRKFPFRNYFRKN